MAITFSLFWITLFKSFSLAFGLFSIGSIMCLVSGITMPLQIIQRIFETLLCFYPPIGYHTEWILYIKEIFGMSQYQDVFCSCTQVYSLSFQVKGICMTLRRP